MNKLLWSNMGEAINCGKTLISFIIMTIPFRCATRHKRDMKSECGHAAFKNMCKNITWGSRHTTQYVKVSSRASPFQRWILPLSVCGLPPCRLCCGAVASTSVLPRRQILFRFRTVRTPDRGCWNTPWHDQDRRRSDETSFRFPYSPSWGWCDCGTTFVKGQVRMFTNI